MVQISLHKYVLCVVILAIAFLICKVVYQSFQKYMLKKEVERLTGLLHKAPIYADVFEALGHNPETINEILANTSYLHQYARGRFDATIPKDVAQLVLDKVQANITKMNEINKQIESWPKTSQL